MTFSLLPKENTGLVLVDLQDKLMQVMGQPQRTIDSVLKLLHLAETYDLPLVVTEQHPKWLGPTVEAVRSHLAPVPALAKMDFNCCRVEAFNHRLESLGLQNIVLMGVETHICILQTCLSLLEKSYRVWIPLDAVDSRTEQNWQVGLELMRQAGAFITSCETVIFQILERAGSKEFKRMMKIVR